MSDKKIPQELNRIADVVLNYRPTEKQKPPRKRKSRAKPKAAKKQRAKVQNRESSI